MKKILVFVIILAMTVMLASCGSNDEIVEHSISIAQELLDQGNPGAAKIAINKTLEKYPDNEKLLGFLEEIQNSISDNPVPNDSQVMEQFHNAYSLYVKWFALGIDRVSHEKVKTKEAGNVEYYVVKEEGFSSVSDIENVFLNYFSPDYFAEIVSSSPVSYEDINGVLYLKYNKDESIPVKTIDELSIRQSKINDDNFEITYQVLYNGGKAGMANGSTHYIRSTEGYVFDTEAISEIECPIESGQYYINLSADEESEEIPLAELRDLPHNNAEVIVSLENGTEVTVCSGNDTWAYVESENFSGWICITYLRQGTPEDTEESAGDFIGGLVDSGLDFIRHFF